MSSKKEQVCKPKEFFNLKLRSSAGSKHGTVQVSSVYSDHATCVCGLYKYDNIFKHSLAVAAFNSTLAAHLDFIKKKSRKDRTRTALAEYDVRRDTAGNKENKRKYPYRPARVMAQPNSSHFAETASTTLQPGASRAIRTFSTGRRSLLSM